MQQLRDEKVAQVIHRKLRLHSRRVLSPLGDTVATRVVDQRVQREIELEERLDASSHRIFRPEVAREEVDL